MKAAHSLEEERQALLDQIHTSRDTYRRMLTAENETEEAVSVPQSRALKTPERFPRSMTLRWIVDHPYLLATGVAGAALLAPRRIRKQVSHSVSSSVHTVAPPRARKAAKGVFTGVITLATMLLKDPAKMRMLTRTVSTALNYARQRRVRPQPGSGSPVRRRVVVQEK